jgi:NAD(P)-dependent dehydrogenase (short-subunit alcohol dehydrogenase family)
MSKQKIALITGGSRGLGEDMAIQIANKGIDVIITYKTKEAEANEVVNAIQSTGRKAAALFLDMNAFDELDNFVTGLRNILTKEFNAENLDCLINNAGMGSTVPFEAVTETMFNEFLNVHFKSVFFLTQKIIPLMPSGASIVNISSSTTAYFVPGYSVYASLKSAIEVFTKYLAFELGKKGIRANAVAPGPVETDFNNAAIRNNPDRKKYLGSLSPLDRVGQSDDIGSVVAFLCTEEAKWINGQIIKVNGGLV